MLRCVVFCYTFEWFLSWKVGICVHFRCFVICVWQNNDICICPVCDFWREVYRLWLFVVLFSVWFPICSLREAIWPSRVCEGKGRGMIERDVRLSPPTDILRPLRLLSVHRPRGFVASARFEKIRPTRASIRCFFVFCHHLFTFWR